MLSLGPSPNVQVFADGSGNGLYGAMKTATVIPEPSSLLLLAGPLLALALSLSRKRKA